jgi:hypothetical protein
MLFMSSDFSFSYPDVDGQWMTYTISSNSMMMLALFKLAAGALTLL